MRRRIVLLLALLISCSGTRIPSSSVPSTPGAAETTREQPTRTAVGAAGKSWAAGTPAAATTAMLTPTEPVALRVPTAIAERVTGPTLLFYFSPTCPHCESVMPEINQLRTQLTELTFIGIPTGSATPAQIARFIETHGADFEMVHETDRGFSQAVGARSTPTVYIARPPRPDEEPANSALIATGADITLLEAYAPFGRGIGAILALRMHPEDPFRDFASGYQGDRVCSTCRQQEALSWAMTHHSVAYRTLH